MQQIKQLCCGELSSCTEAVRVLNVRCNKFDRNLTFRNEMDSAPQLVTTSVSFRSRVSVRTKMMKNLMPPSAKNLFSSSLPNTGKMALRTRPRTLPTAPALNRETVLSLLPRTSSTELCAFCATRGCLRVRGALCVHVSALAAAATTQAINAAAISIDELRILILFGAQRSKTDLNFIKLDVSGCNYSTADLTCTSEVVSDEVCTTL
eukprot:9206-Heterococcus_DN1.PRE.3